MSLATDAMPGFAAPVHSEVSLLRLYMLRATYLAIAFFMGSQMWPLLFHHRPWPLMHGVAVCMLAAVSAVAAIGLRHPLKVLPLLFLEMIWKATWLIALGYPAWKAGTVDANMAENIKACAMGIIFPIVIPWGYVWKHYVKAPGDRWW